MFAWTTLWSIFFFYAMQRIGILRISKDIEIIGLDIAELGGFSHDDLLKMKLS